MNKVDRFIAEWRQMWRDHQRETRAAMKSSDAVPLPEPPMVQARDVDMLIAEIQRLRRKLAPRGEE